ncbi:unnamed protein product [Prunus armeniaca]|uniref:Uncharacterized protein n=1 Tax=Prunus armeniaca TaxID=36596 RepID=A0A6J5Y8I6_PRUAR|nr:unnamed protein product [Prunus armeniaca]
MARSFSNAKLLSALVADGFSSTITRRGYAAGSQGVASSVVRGGGATSPRSVNVVKNSGEDKVTSASKVSWVPQPENRVLRTREWRRGDRRSRATCGAVEEALRRKEKFSCPFPKQEKGEIVRGMGCRCVWV